KRFHHEAATLSRLRHLHIVGIHDYDVAADGTPYLLMELLEGEDLRAVLKRTGCLPWKAALAVVEQTAQALSALHSVGQGPRDLSPANIFLVRQPPLLPEDAVFVKLLDFGIVRSQRLDAERFTEVGALVGNAPYMAPECILPPRPASGAPATGSEGEGLLAR